MVYTIITKNDGGKDRGEKNMKEFTTIADIGNIRLGVDGKIVSFSNGYGDGNVYVTMYETGDHVPQYVNAPDEDQYKKVGTVSGAKIDIYLYDVENNEISDQIERTISGPFDILVNRYASHNAEVYLIQRG